ncbi:MAG: hypothetical protein GY854_15340 [Deltaproteobacteria bacterium]|nr:hypothetical protein [Deltaproteobacteria bacterium]
MAITITKSLNADVETFIAELKKETGVNDRFLEEARSAIEKTFSDVPEERRDACLQAIMESAKRQAETEMYLERATQSAKRLGKSHSALFDRLNSLKKQTTQAKETIATAAVNIYTMPARCPDPGIMN